MAFEQKTASGCVPTSLKCSVTSGVVSEVIGIEDGEPINSALGKIVTEVECLLQEKEGKSSGGSGSSSVSEGGTTTAGTSGVIENFTSRQQLTTPVTLSSKAIGDNISFSYNFSGALSELKCPKTTASVEVTSASGSRVYKSSSTTGSANLKAEDYPIVFNTEVSCIKDGKETTVSFSKQIREVTSEVQEYVTAKCAESVQINNQEDRNAYYDQQIADLNFRLTGTESINIDGTKDLNDTIACQNAEIKELQASQASIDTTCEGKTLCEAFELITALQNQVQVLADEVARLTTIQTTNSKIN